MAVLDTRPYTRRLEGTLAVSVFGAWADSPSYERHAMNIAGRTGEDAEEVRAVMESPSFLEVAQEYAAREVLEIKKLAATINEDYLLLVTARIAESELTPAQHRLKALDQATSLIKYRDKRNLAKGTGGNKKKTLGQRKAAGEAKGRGALKLG